TANAGAALRALYWAGYRHGAAALSGACHISGLVAGALDRRAVPGDGTVEQQCAGTLAIWFEHRPFAIGDYRVSHLLDMAVGAAWPGSVDPANRLPRRSRKTCSAIRIPGCAARQRAGSGAACKPLPAASGR